MQKVSYMGDGATTEFVFNFPYFEDDNVVVTVNNQTASAYNIVGTAAGQGADIPYTGGKVVFENAPSDLDSITISRQLPLSRIVDYQPLATINPTTLNQDMNYMMEVLKDLQDQLDEFGSKYADIVDKDSTTTLLARIAAIAEDITTVSAQITALGDVSGIRSSISTLDNRTTNLSDYVVQSQSPTSQNNYTWYRRYKSGWVEQGGLFSNSQRVTTVNMPVTMSNNKYVVHTTLLQCASDWHETVGIGVLKNSQTTSSFQVQVWYGTSSYTSGSNAWRVCGMAAQ